MLKNTDLITLCSAIYQTLKSKIQGSGFSD